jgi:hypothetical protein
LLTRHRSKEIRWLGTQQDLLYLIRKLIDNELIGPEAKSIYAAIAAHHFVDRNGKPFKPDQLRVVWSGMHRKEAKSATRRRIDPIVEKIRGK